eukprot:NODE_113_length_18482_cov_1.630746.p16 type:complete len:158 gc:universal NODE_113_length_18482_cov_1.630746:2161-2634(+)
MSANVLKEQISLIFYNWPVMQYMGSQLDRSKLMWFVETITNHLHTYYNSKKAFIDEIEDILMDVLEAEFQIYLEDGCMDIATLCVLAKSNKLDEQFLRKQVQDKPCQSLRYLLDEDCLEESEDDSDSMNDCESFEHIHQEFKQLDIDEDGWTLVKHK